MYTSGSSGNILLCIIGAAVNCGWHVNTGMLGAAFDVVGAG